MRRLLLGFILLLVCSTIVFGAESDVLPEIGEDVLLQELPSEASELLGDMDISNTGIFESFVSVFTKALGKITKSIREGLRTAGILLIILLLCKICNTFETRRSVCIIVGALGILSAVMGSVGSMIRLSRDTVCTLTEYGGFMLPIMASALAVSGNPITAGGLHGLTVLFSQILMNLITDLLIPGVYLFLSLSTVEVALQNTLLGELREFLFWIMSKTLRIFMYIFTGFLSLTGVISGATDALTVKTTKAAVSGMIPVVGSILSDASDSLLAGAAIVKNTLGIFGMIAVLSIGILPFLRVGIQYLILKITAACSGTIAMKEHTALLKHISSAMGLLLAITGTCTVLLLISGICFLRVTAF